MDTLRSLQVFKAIVEEGSFTKAAKRLDISLAMTSKHLQHLEQYVQAKLLHRNNRQLSLTETGQQYYHEAIQALDILQQAQNKAQNGSVLAEGRLKIIAPVWFATPYFVDLLAKFQQMYPKIQLSVDLENRFTDLIAEGYDLALRVIDMPQENLIVKPLSQVGFFYVASPNWLQRYGNPTSAEDLRNSPSILPNYTQMTTPLSAYNDSNNTQMLAQMAIAGMGVAILPEWLIYEPIAQKKLVKLFDTPVNTVPIFAVYMNRTFLTVKVRLLIDFLEQQLKN